MRMIRALWLDGKIISTETKDKMREVFKALGEEPQPENKKELRKTGSGSAIADKKKTTMCGCTGDCVIF